VEDEPVHGQIRRDGAKHQGGARGVSVDVSAAGDRVDQRGDVLDVPVDVIGERVAAVAATAPVVVDGREVLAECSSRGTHQGAIARSTTDHDQGRAGAEGLIRDGGAIR
jgi:hypothetical protein